MKVRPTLDEMVNRLEEKPPLPEDERRQFIDAIRLTQRELEIQAALERVRDRSMAMQSSEELSDVLSVLFRQFDLLGIAPLTAWLTLWQPEDNTFIYRSTGTSGKRMQGQQVLDINGMEVAGICTLHFLN